MKTYHVYGLSAYDGKLHHWRVKAKDSDDAQELFSATEDDNDLTFIVLERKLKGTDEHSHIITAKDIGE
jgi:hypothetical protein